MSEIPKKDIPESSTRNPSDSDEDETPESECKSFVLEGRPARQLKLALDSLSDPVLNDDGNARIDVNEDGLEITVKDKENERNCMGHVLLLAKAEVINFRFYKPVEGKIVPLDDIFLNFDNVEDDDPFTISHDHVSDELLFVFGNGNPPKEFKVELMDNTKGVPKFPSPISFCEANVPSDELSHLLPHLSKDGICQLVGVYITNKSINIEAGGKRVYHHTYDPTEVGLEGIGVGQKHHASFDWPYADIFKTASELSPAFILCLLNEPAKSIMFKFQLLDLGHLEFIKKAHKMIPNVEALTEFLLLSAQVAPASEGHVLIPYNVDQ